MVDDYTRECLAIEVDASLPGQRVKQVPERLREMRGLPGSITVDNGPEFAGKVLDAGGYESGVTLSFIRPGTLFLRKDIAKKRRPRRIAKPPNDAGR